MAGSDAEADGGRSTVPGTVLLRTFLRGFLIQGSWNYRTMIGHGFGFALLPVLRWLYSDEELEDAVRRHTLRFNAHPYLAELALGAVAGLEEEGQDRAFIQRFKDALGAPLGGIGDSLVWAAYLPACLLGALVLGAAGVAPWLCVGAFLVVYNAGHVGLRIWAFRTGRKSGVDVAWKLKAARLADRTERITMVGSVLAGVLIGVWLVAGPPGAPSLMWNGLAVTAVVAGAMIGERAWRPTAMLVVGAVGTTIALYLLLST